MMDDKSIIQKGKEIIKIEAEAIIGLENRINESFAQAVNLIYNAKGRVVLTGTGKSGIIARKIAATMNSTGTPSAFMHPSDAMHGDLGMVTPNDVVICVSKSGNTAELKELLPRFHHLGVKIVAMVGNIDSLLAKQSDVVLDISVKEEACPYDLAPTSSTTAALVMGDALAITLLQKRNFTEEDFAKFHPGGSLGKRLLLKVESMMVAGKDVPIVKDSVSLSEAIVEISSKRLGATCIVNSNGILCGILTDGDLRRVLQRTTSISDLTVDQVMNRNPKTINKNILAVQALKIMENYKITQLIVIDETRRPIGMIHLHDLVEAGIRGDASS